LIDRDDNGNLTFKIFKEQQKSSEMLSILGYGKTIKNKRNISDLIKKEVL
jgi:arginine decarboxylase